MYTRQTISILTLAALLITAGTATAQTEPLLPRIGFSSPQAVAGQVEAAQLTSSPTFILEASSQDPGVSVTSHRFLLKRALLPDGSYATTRNDYQNHVDDLTPFDDAEWTEWQLWPGGAGAVTLSFVDLPQTEPDPNNPGQMRNIYYLLATQVMTADGVVSIDRRYGYNVANFRISSNVSPYLAIYHPLLGSFRGAGINQLTAFDLLGNVPGEFEWEADATSYGGTLASYRWGWDILDLDDPNDPGWALPPGLSDAHRHTGEIPFASGIHTLTVQATDTNDAISRRVFTLTFVPVPDPSVQLPVLLVDDVKDRQSNAWTDAQGNPRDRDEYRDEFWLSMLVGDGGVAGFDPVRDVIDTEEQQVEIRDVVKYRAVVWTSRWVSAPNSAISSEFRPIDYGYAGIIQKYVWLGSYQEQAGNLLLAGNRAANDFVPESPYMLPVIYDSQAGSVFGWEFVNGQDVRVGFGPDPNGDPIYPELHGYRNLGLAAFDITSPNAAYYTPEGYLVRTKRKSSCVGMKGLVLDQDYVTNHMGGAAAFADTIWTDGGIDWNDPAFPEDNDVLYASYLWGNDEFYDADVQGRNVAVVPQDCDGEACVEPLLRMASRFEWVQAAYLAEDPDSTWPEGYYGGDGQPSLELACGTEALTGDRSATVTNNQVTAFVTHKFQDQKPSQVGDVVMGFDPYRFDNEPMKEALHWVLGEHFGLNMNP